MKPRLNNQTPISFTLSFGENRTFLNLTKYSNVHTSCEALYYSHTVGNTQKKETEKWVGWNSHLFLKL